MNGVALHKLDEGRLTIWRGSAVGIIFQFFQLMPTMTLLENVILPMDFCHYTSPRKRRERALQLLAAVDLSEQRNRLPAFVSGGQQQRAAIARALANDPPILVADEPTGNLDSNSAEAVFQLLEGLVAQGKTVILVTHDSDLARRCRRVIHIADGCIVADELNPAPIPVAEPVMVLETGK
jgi:putative ABC transport system ATP-binding protein